MRVAILMTCFNRRALTLRCLRSLLDTLIWSKENRGHDAQLTIDVFLNDDGSTDGTGEAIKTFKVTEKSDFRINLVQGSGHDYWCGGMRRAWQAAIDSGIDYDGYLWLNDDTMLNNRALDEMLISDDALVVGAICDSTGKTNTFGGYDKQGYFVKCNGKVQEVERINGNVVWVPRKVFQEIGNFDRHWTHSFGDGDYSLLVREAGMKILLTAHFVGTCEREDKLSPWQDPSKPFRLRLKNLYSPLGYAEPPLYFRYCRKHYGLARAIKTWVLQHVHVCFPSLWMRKLAKWKESRVGE